MLAGGDVSKDEEEEVLTLAIGSLKDKGLPAESELVKPV